jgi:hypothetical protein
MAAKFAYDVEVTTAEVPVGLPIAGRVTSEKDHMDLTYTQVCRTLDNFRDAPIFRGERNKPRPGKPFVAGFGRIAAGVAQATVIKVFPKSL